MCSPVRSEQPPLVCGKKPMWPKVAVFFGFAAVAPFAPIVAQQRDDRIGGLPKLGEPRVLYSDPENPTAEKDGASRSFSSLAFTRDSRSLVAAVEVFLPRFLLTPLRSGEVRSFDVAGGGSRVVTAAEGEWIEILASPSGVCRDPLLLARGRMVGPQEVVVFQVASGVSDESILGRFPVPRAQQETSHTDDSICVTVTSEPATILLGTRRLDFEPGSDSPIWRGDVAAWDLNTSATRLAEPWDGWQVLDLTCSDDGEVIAAGGGRSREGLFGRSHYDGRVVCWDGELKKKLLDLTLPGHQVHCLTFSPDGMALVTGGLDGAVTWIDVARGVAVRSLNAASHSGKSMGRIESLAFSPNGELLAAGVGSYNRGNKWGEVLLIDANKAVVYEVPSSREDHVITSVAFSPDGKYLAAGSMTGVLKLWQFGVGE